MSKGKDRAEKLCRVAALKATTLATHQDQTLFELRNMVLNDQGGGRMNVTQGTSGTLRAQEHGHPPITFDKVGGTEKT